MVQQEYKFNTIINLANTVTKFEINNSDLKMEYIIKNIELFNDIAKKIKNSAGSFGTGYPFYAIGQETNGKLPIILEQIRYNNELIASAIDNPHKIWCCQECLIKKGETMPDLKSKCKPCHKIDDSLKPRKVINRLPDVDMWIINKNADELKELKEILINNFNINKMYPSDINPIKTFEDIIKIENMLSQNILPEINLPLDAHIINYDTLFSLISEVPFTLMQAKKNDEIPYLPIHPVSYRKKWQKDDKPYNFIHDFLYSFTDFNFDIDLKELIDYSRKQIIKNFTIEELSDYAINTGSDCVSRRQKNKELKLCFEERMKSWQQL